MCNLPFKKKRFVNASMNRRPNAEIRNKTADAKNSLKIIRRNQQKLVRKNYSIQIKDAINRKMKLQPKNKSQP